MYRRRRRLQNRYHRPPHRENSNYEESSVITLQTVAFEQLISELDGLYINKSVRDIPLDSRS
jgi:hypothetical protein